jgi:hypothetical protein
MESYPVETYNLLHSIVTGDESWIYHFDPEKMTDCGMASYHTAPHPYKKWGRKPWS